MASKMIFVLAILLINPFAFAVEISFPYCCGSPYGPYCYPDQFLCDVFCAGTCFPYGDFSGFGYDCEGYYGYDYTCQPGGDGGGKKLSVNLDPSCDGNVVTVEDDDGDPVSGAYVSVKDVDTADLIDSGNTDDDGVFTFDACGMDVDVKVTKSGYSKKTITDSLMDCEQCAPETCVDDTDCPDNEQCLDGDCVPVPCECGSVQNHQCVEYACCSDSDCGPNEVCVDNSCQEKPPEVECDSDADCPSAQYCDIPTGQDSGTCEDVQPGDCGEIKDHQFVPYGYECGSELGCPSCPSGYVCYNHGCIQSDITCPSTGIVGDEKTCSASEDGEPCANCDYVVTDPGGNNFTGKTDEDGNFDLPLNLEGIYKVALLKNGTVVKIIEVKAFPQGQPDEGEKPTAGAPDSGPLIGILLLLLLIVLGIIYWRRRGQKK